MVWNAMENVFARAVSSSKNDSQEDEELAVPAKQPSWMFYPEEKPWHHRRNHTRFWVTKKGRNFCKNIRLLSAGRMISTPDVDYLQMLIWRLEAFVEEVLELVELTPLSGASVGLPGVDGLSTEQRKRLTLAVELVANPSTVFMDEQLQGRCYCDDDCEEYCEYRPNNRVH